MEPKFDRQRVKELAQALVLWRAKKISDGITLAKIADIFKPEFTEYWVAYNKGRLAWYKKIGFVR